MKALVFKNVQIVSAIIWATTILLCSLITRQSSLQMLLVTAAGIHVLMMAQLMKQKGQSCNY